MFINLSFNNPKSNNIFDDIFKSQIDRGIIPGEYNSYFCRYLGVGTNETYNNKLALLKNKENDLLKIIDLSLNRNKIINHDIDKKIELHREEFYKYTSVLSDNTLNFRIYKAIDFINEVLRDLKKSVDRIIEITKFVMVNIKEYINDIIWNDLETNKYVFYGEATEDETYLMLVFKLLGIDVLYLSPEGKDINSYIDILDKYSFKVSEKESFEKLSFDERVNKGKVILEYKTIGKEAAYALEKTMFNEETGFYKPWQFIDYGVNSVLLNSTFEEIMIYYNEKGNVRPGFKVNNNKVNIPNFFAVVTGVLSDSEEFGEFLRTIFNKDNVLVLDNIAIYNYPIGYEEALSYKGCFDNSGKVTKEKIDFHVAGGRFKNYREGLKSLFVDKINEILENSYMINATFKERDKVEYLATIMTMPEEFYQLIDSFDFTDKIPKITIYRDNNQGLEIRELYVLSFLNSIGIDIILYSGFGTYGIEKWTNGNFITYHRLDKVEYNFNLENAMRIYKKKGFFSKLFKK